jgi:hypothetical protein
MRLCSSGMHLSRVRIVLVLGAVLLVPVPALCAVVWKWVDADGVVHFSDQPVPGAQKIVTSTGAKGIGGNVGPSSPEAQKNTAPTPAPTQFAITSPAPQETITGNQPVLVHLDLAPALTPTQSITWFLNGQPLANQAPDAVQFALEDLPRGTYSVSATLADQSNGETRSTEAVTFYVVRPSILSPTHK